jgi:hypothetical protein
MATENEGVDDFAAAFAEAVKVVEAPDDAAAAAAQAAEMGTADDKPAPAADDKPAPAADDKPAPAADDKPAPAADDKPAPAADDKPAPAADDKPAPAADDKPAPAADGKPAPAADAGPTIDEQFPDPQYTEEEQKAIAEFEKNWDEISPVFNIKLKHAIAAVEAKAARTIAKVVENIYSDFTPLINSHLKSEATSFRGAVLKAHEDYDAVYPKLDGWIKAHPAYLQSGLLKAYNEGTAEEVIDLVSRYKQANGVKPQAAAPAAPEQGETKKPAAAAAAALAPVDTKRTTPKPSGDDPNDYDSAFDEAAASLTR